MPGHIAGLMPRFISCGLILFAGLLGLGGCGGYNAPSQPPPTPSSVIISPTNASVKAGTGTQNFTATVMNDYLSRGVTWALSGAGCSGATCGSLSNMTSSSATYNAPSAVPNPATVTLTATGQRHLEKFHCDDHRYGGCSCGSRGSVAHDDGHAARGRDAAVVRSKR